MPMLLSLCGTGGCRYENIRCCQWRQYGHHDNSWFCHLNVIHNRNGRTQTCPIRNTSIRRKNTALTLCLPYSFTPRRNNKQASNTSMLKYFLDRPVAQIPQYTSPTSHNAPICNRNVHMFAHFCHIMMHCGIFVRCIVGFVKLVYSAQGMQCIVHLHTIIFMQTTWASSQYKDVLPVQGLSVSR